MNEKTTVQEIYYTKRQGAYTWWQEGDDHIFTWGTNVADCGQPDAIANTKEQAAEWWNGTGPLGSYHRLLPGYQYLQEHLGELFDLGVVSAEEMHTVLEPLNTLLTKVGTEYGTDHGEAYWEERNAKENMRLYLTNTWEW